MIRRCVIAVRRWSPGKTGGISALRNITDTVDEAYAIYANDDDVTRVMVVDCDGDTITVLRDVTFPSRVDAPDEWRRLRRLDKMGDDSTMHGILYDCHEYPCRHLSRSA